MVLEAVCGRHGYDFNFDPTPQRPMVRVYPEIRWRNPPSPAQWVRDAGFDVDLETVGLFNRGVSHFLDETMLCHEFCDICQARRAFRYDDFFGYVCTLCEITHPLRFKARGVNPWGARMVR